ncbi:trypco2 family protein [Streptomyces sp. NPDC003362]
MKASIAFCLVMTMAEEWAPTLTDAIAQVRAELEAALQAGDGQAVRFGVGEVELEFLVETRRNYGGNAGVRFYVVSLGGKAERQHGQTNRVRVSLQPVSSDGQTLQVAAEGSGRPDAVERERESSTVQPSPAPQSSERPDAHG